MNIYKESQTINNYDFLDNVYDSLINHAGSIARVFLQYNNCDFLVTLNFVLQFNMLMYTLEVLKPLSKNVHGRRVGLKCYYKYV